MMYVTGVWIDHKKAVIVSIGEGRVSTRTVTSDIDPHPRYGGSQEGGGEQKYEERHRQSLAHYYDDVITQIGQPEALLLFGPGEAKRELEARLSHARALSRCPVATETTDKLTEAQIVEKVKDHYGVAR